VTTWIKGEQVRHGASEGIGVDSQGLKRRHGSKGGRDAAPKRVGVGVESVNAGQGREVEAGIARQHRHVGWP
jgi:hypothetical protein